MWEQEQRPLSETTRPNGGQAITDQSVCVPRRWEEPTAFDHHRSADRMVNCRIYVYFKKASWRNAKTRLQYIRLPGKRFGEIGVGGNWSLTNRYTVFNLVSQWKMTMWGTGEGVVVSIAKWFHVWRPPIWHRRLFTSVRQWSGRLTLNQHDPHRLFLFVSRKV